VKFLNQLENPKVVVWVILILLYLDSGLTYFLLKSWPNDAVEGNPLTRGIIDFFGLDLSLLVILPVIFAFGSWLIYRWWYLKIIRWLTYLIILSRVLVIPWHIYLAYAVFSN